MKKKLLIVMVMLMIGSCSTNPNKEEVYNQTKEANDASLDGHIRKDVNAIVSVYTEDAVILPPGGLKPVYGIDSIKNYYTKSLMAPGKTMEIGTETTLFDVIDNNNATQIGNYVIKHQASDSSVVTEFRGEMLIVWKRIQGEWKIYLDMWH